MQWKIVATAFSLLSSLRFGDSATFFENSMSPISEILIFRAKKFWHKVGSKDIPLTKKLYEADALPALANISVYPIQLALFRERQIFPNLTLPNYPQLTSGTLPHPT